MKRIALTAALSLVVGIAAGTILADTARADEAAQIASQTRDVLRNNCARCHHGPGSEGGEFDLLNPAHLVEYKLIVPGRPDQSRMLKRIVAGEMPPKPARMFVQDGDLLSRWIAEGAPAFSAPTAPRTFLGMQEILLTMRDYLRTVDRNDRVYLRFFTLHNLHNDDRVLNEDLRRTRAALSKTINSLSWKPRVVLPQAIDKAQTLYVVDVRQLDWDRTDGWNKLMKAYPYGLKYYNDDVLRPIDEEIELLTGCDLPLIRADWFIASATRPPLYHSMLELPESDSALEKMLKVDVAKNFMNPIPERIARAGFARSGVSAQNRLLERHESVYGSYWKSYDFKPDTGRANLTRYPLGPLNMFPEGKHPYPDQAFNHDGGEMIFSLPNGLNAYLLTDGKGKRIDEGPIEVVGDSLKTSGSFAIVNGVSCMSCHRNGMLPFEDSLREHSAVFGQAEEQVRRLFPPKDVLDDLRKQDEERFMTALEQAIGPFVKSDAGQSIREYGEPIGESARIYRNGYLDLKTVALELNIADPQQLLTRVGEKTLKQLGLEPLTRPGGVIPRLQWESVDGVSLMQQLARELRLSPWRTL